MMPNPFTPSFGGWPEHFFGRSEVITDVSRALEVPYSPNRALFITGSRGSGKTALLERLSQLARERQWISIDVHSAHAVSSVMEQLAKAMPQVALNISSKVSVPGIADLSVSNVSPVTRSQNLHLSTLLIECASTLVASSGIFITVDEIQKIPEQDMEEICTALQLARRKALPVAFVAAGLPGSKEQVAGYAGCTFMQRVGDRHIASLKVSETLQAFTDMLALTPDIITTHEVIRELAKMSQGYPYLIQLVGYHFVNEMRATYPVGSVSASSSDVREVGDLAYGTYRENVIVPSLRGLRAEGKAYLRTMAELMTDGGIVATGDVVQRLGKTPSQLSSCRQNLIDRRLVRAMGRGKISFALPYLTRYFLELPEPDAVLGDDEWTIS